MHALHDLSDKGKIIYGWIQLMDYIIREMHEITENRFYAKINNEVIMKLQELIKKELYINMLPLCDEGISLIKLVSGNHYHIWLFFMLKNLLKSEIKLKRE